ncbi:MAG: hypothetical protein ACXADW_23055 [Candidatus Hodarchaeales archaeon]|jgi:6-pyruvoyl-tetrahydropterin synthase
MGTEFVDLIDKLLTIIGESSPYIFIGILFYLTSFFLIYRYYKIYNYKKLKQGYEEMLKNYDTSYINNIDEFDKSVQEILKLNLEELSKEQKMEYTQNLDNNIKSLEEAIKAFGYIENRIIAQKERISKKQDNAVFEIIPIIEKLIKLNNLSKSKIIKTANRIYEYLGNPISRARSNKE